MARCDPWASGVWLAASAASRGRVLVILAAAALCVPRGVPAANLFESLTDSEQKEVIEKLQGLLEEDLERDDALLVRNTFDRNEEGESEADDPLHKAILKEISELDVQRFAQAAGSLSTGDVRPLRDAAIAAGLSKMGGAMKEWTADRFEKNGVGKLVFSTLADQTAVYKEILSAIFDPAKSWCAVANVAWDETRKAILEASQDSAEEIAKQTLNWIFGEGPLAALGATPGDAYLKLLSLETEYFKALPRRLGAAAGQRIFEMYWQERQPPPRGAGKSEDAAWDAIDPYLAGSQGRWFLDLAGDEARARRALDRCFTEGSSNVFLCLDRRVEEKREEAWNKLCNETAAAAEPTRAATAQKLVWLSDTLRRLIEERLAARRDDNLLAAQDAARRARARLADLRRLAQEQERLCEKGDLVAMAGAASGTFAALDGLATSSQSAPVWRLDECARIADAAAETAESRARDLAARVRSRVAEANAASTGACDWPDPTTVAAAQDNLRAAARAGNRVEGAANAARAALAELEALAAAVRANPPGLPAARFAELRAARDAVRSALAEWARAPALADACRAARLTWEQRSSRLGRLDLAIQGIAVEVVNLAGEAAGLREATDIVAETEAIRDRSGDCLARRASQQGALVATRESNLQVCLSVVSAIEQKARAALAACAALDAVPPSPLAAIEAELAVVRRETARLDDYQGAVLLCVGSATSWVDRLQREEADRQRAAAATAAGAGWTAVGDVQTVAGGSGASGGSAGSGRSSAPNQPDADVWIQAAIDAYNNCQMGAALGHARRVQAMAPDHPWLAANLGLITRRQEAQARSAAALGAARAAANSGDLRGALDAATRAAQDAPSCMTGSISDSLEQMRDQMSANRADQLARNREVFVRMVDSWMTAWSAAATAGITHGGGGPGTAGAGDTAPRHVACSTATEQGGDTPETIFVAVGNATGLAMFRWEVYDIKDRIVVEYGGQTLLDTGCVSGSGSRPLQLSGLGGQAVVRVMPNCAGQSGTNWKFWLECPR